MTGRLLIIARDFNAAQHWAKRNRLSPGVWVYASSYHNIRGNTGCNHVLIDGWKERPDWEILAAELKAEKSEPSETYRG